MGQTVTVDEFRGRFVPDFLAEVLQGHEPLIVRLDNGESGAASAIRAIRKLLLSNILSLSRFWTLPGSVPSGWKDALYDEQH